MSKHQYVNPYQIAELYTALGDKDHAFEWSLPGFDYVYLTAWPANDSLRPDPRYPDLLRRIGVSTAPL